MCAIEQYRSHGLIRRVSNVVHQTIDAPQTECLKLRHESIRPSNSPTTSPTVMNETLQKKGKRTLWCIERKGKNALRSRTKPIANRTLQQAKTTGFQTVSPSTRENEARDTGLHISKLPPRDRALDTWKIQVQCICKAQRGELGGPAIHPPKEWHKDAVNCFEYEKAP